MSEARGAPAVDLPLGRVRAAVRERFIVGRHGAAVLLVAALLFVLVRLRFGVSPALALATGLWCGYCVAHLGVLVAGRMASKAAVGDRIWAVALLAVAILAASAVLGRDVEARFWPMPELGRGETAVRYGWHLAFVAALIALPIGRAVAQARRLAASEAQRELASARLLALQAQIEPHFLFNTLAALRSLIRRDADAAAALLDRMTEFLRAVLPEARRTSSTLAREADILEAYLAIMQSRIGSERLGYSVEIEPAALDAPMPPLLLQPLVENAVRHGIEPSENGGVVTVRASRDDDALTVVVRNTGEPLHAPGGDAGTAPRRGGTGLANVRSRLATLHGEGGSLSLASEADGATLATLRLPLRRAAGAR